jgi:phage shock protein C
MICGHCRRDIADNSNFCYYCGAQQVVPPVGAAYNQRRLMRSSVDCKISGVCGGFGEYFAVDSTIVRLIWVLVTFFSGIVPGVIGYFVAWMVMPQAPYPVIVTPAPQAAPPPGGSQSAQPI